MQALSPENVPLNLYIEAQDGLRDEYPRFQLIIVLQDVNDNPPVIDSQFPSTLRVSEVCDSVLADL